MAERKDAMAKRTRPYGFPRNRCSLLLLLIVLACSEDARCLAPKIVTTKLLDDIEIGQRVSIVCSLKEGTPPIFFSWRKDGAPIVASSELRVLHNDEFQESLQIARTTPEHVGNYTCSAKNSYGSDQMSVAVVPKFKPAWLQNEQKTVVGVAGQTVTLDCTARGQPVPSVTVWKGRRALVKLRVHANCLGDSDGSAADFTAESTVEHRALVNVKK